MKKRSFNHLKQDTLLDNQIKFLYSYIYHKLFWLEQYAMDNNMYELDKNYFMLDISNFYYRENTDIKFSYNSLKEAIRENMYLAGDKKAVKDEHLNAYIINIICKYLDDLEFSYKITNDNCILVDIASRLKKEKVLYKKRK